MLLRSGGFKAEGDFLAFGAIELTRDRACIGVLRVAADRLCDARAFSVARCDGDGARRYCRIGCTFLLPRCAHRYRRGGANGAKARDLDARKRLPGRARGGSFIVLVRANTIAASIITGGAGLCTNAANPAANAHRRRFVAFVIFDIARAQRAGGEAVLRCIRRAGDHRAFKIGMAFNLDIKAAIPCINARLLLNARKIAALLFFAEISGNIGTIVDTDRQANIGLLAIIGRCVPLPPIVPLLLVAKPVKNEEIVGKLMSDTEAAYTAIDGHIREVDRYSSAHDEARPSVPALREDIKRQRSEINALSEQVSELKAELERIKPKPLDRNRPAG